MESNQLSLFETQGSTQGSLTTMWVYKFNELHPLKQVLELYATLTTTSNLLAKVTVTTRARVIDKKAPVSHYDKKFYQFLPAKYNTENNILHIPLNSTEIITALVNNSWTTDKKGKRIALKEYPLSITVECSDYLTHFEFKPELGLTPALAAESKLSALKDNEYTKTIFNF